MNANVKYRMAKSRGIQALIIFFAFLITIPLLLIILYIFREGITKINWNFLTKIPKPVGESGGGIVKCTDRVHSDCINRFCYGSTAWHHVWHLSE